MHVWKGGLVSGRTDGRVGGVDGRHGRGDTSTTRRDRGLIRLCGRRPGSVRRRSVALYSACTAAISPASQGLLQPLRGAPSDFIVETNSNDGGYGGGGGGSEKDYGRVPEMTVPARRPSVRPSVGPTVHPSIRPSVCPSVRSSVRPCDRPSVRSSVRPSVRPTIHPSIRPSICPSVRPSVRLSVRPHFRSTVRPSVRPSARTTVGPFGRSSVVRSG